MLRPKGNDETSINAFLGRNTHFKGTLIFDGMVRVDGDFEGTVKTNDTFVIASGGNVKAEIEAGIVKISGKFEGTVIAKNKVELLKPAEVSGKIITGSLSVEDGVIFNGTCEMGNKNIQNNVETK